MRNIEFSSGYNRDIERPDRQQRRSGDDRYEEERAIEELKIKIGAASDD